jgi:tetratricopeptide (TPR) repeat protein
MSFAESWKGLGNSAFKAGDYELAVQHYSHAIDVDNKEPKYYVNRSLAYASMNMWEESAKDAKQAILLDSKYIKAHFRFIKALLTLERLKEVRLALSYAVKECGENIKDFNELQDELFSLTGIPLLPKSTDFEVIGELGEGNFTKVYKAMLKSTQRVFAIKVKTKYYPMKRTLIFQ